MSSNPDLSEFVKAYDVRGLVGSQLTDAVVSAIGAAFVDEVAASGLDVYVGHDMRDSSPGFAAAFARGAQARGANVVAIGLCSTDENYFASGRFDAPAAMFTASHNPATYHGIKLSRADTSDVENLNELNPIYMMANSASTPGLKPSGTARPSTSSPA